MASTAQLAKIVELVQRVGPLAPKQRGMPIEAEDWNALVDVLRGILSIDRVQEETTQASLDLRFAAKEHEHLGEVTVAWLDPELQARIGQGGASALGQTVAAEIDQKITSLSAEVARLTAAVAELRTAGDRASVAEIDRAKMLREFETR